MNTKKLIEQLNQLLAQEHACSIRYATHAAVITGPYAEAIAERLSEIAEDEQDHAAKLRERIVALGGEPTMSIAIEELKAAHTLGEILAINIDEEKQAIDAYTKVLHSVPEDNVILHQTLEDIIKDEQEHLEELENLKP